MSDFQNFNRTIESLRTEVENLEAVSEAYGKLADLVENFETIVETLDSSKKLIAKNDRFHVDIAKTINLKLDNNLIEIKKLINDEDNNIQQQIKSSASQVKSSLDDLKKQIKATKIPVYVFGIIISILSLISIIFTLFH